MGASYKEQKEVWSIGKIIDELYYDLISTKREDGLRKYEEKARLLLYKIPIWREPETGNNQPPDFTIDHKDISEKIKASLLMFLT